MAIDDPVSKPVSATKKSLQTSALKRTGRWGSQVMALAQPHLTNWADRDLEDDGKPKQTALERVWQQAPAELGKQSVQVLRAFRNAFSRRIRKCVGEYNLDHIL